MLPIIVLLTLIIFSILLTFVALGHDLLDKGCVAWHRDSIGYLIQALIAYICILVTAINLKGYIASFEELDSDYDKSKWQIDGPENRLNCCIHFREHNDWMLHTTAGSLNAMACQDSMFPREKLDHAFGHLDLSCLSGFRLREPLR